MVKDPINRFNINDDESLKLVLKKIAEFDKKFCELMFKMTDFTVRLEIRGNAGEIIHVRLNADDVARPKGSQSRIDKKHPNSPKSGIAS